MSRFSQWHALNTDGSQPPFVIAEVGVNHNGSVATAHDLVDVAAACGADCAKFQVFQAEMVAAESARTAEYQERATSSISQLEMIRLLELPNEAWPELKRHCDELGIDFMATAFDELSLDVVDDLAPSAHKIPSGEITNLPFIKNVASRGRPVILSTGMSSTGEVGSALEALGPTTTAVLMHCITAYPTPWELSNLLAITHLREVTDLPVGWSDHTIGSESALMAVALGSRIFEKHITLDCGQEGPDHGASADPAIFSAYVAAVHRGVRALGVLEKELTPIEAPTAALVRRSWHARRDVEPGTTLTSADVIALRPEGGIGTVQNVEGRVAVRGIPAGTFITEENTVSGVIS